MEKLFVFTIGAIGYSLLEIVWRGYTHWTMSLTGGLCLLMIYIANFALPYENIFIKGIFFALLITCTEFIVGVVVNLVFKMQVWDYSALPLNVYGQICALYSLLWYFLSLPLVPFCNMLKNLNFH